MDVLTTILITVAIIVIVFLLCRELNCWYFKINERRELLRTIARNQLIIIELLKGQTPDEEDCQDLKEAPTIKAHAPKDDSFRVGQKVTTKVEKFGLPIGTLVRVDKIGDRVLTCSYEMQEVGIYFFDEVER